MPYLLQGQLFAWCLNRQSMCLQVFLKGKAKRHADVGSKATPVADFVMEGNRNVTYGKIVHQVGCKLIHQ